MILDESHSNITVITAKELKLEREEYEFCDFTHHASYDTSRRGKSLVTSLRDVPALMNSKIQQVCDLTIFEQDYYSFFVGSLFVLQIEIDPAVRVATYLQYPEMCIFFRNEIITLLNEKRLNMVDFADYQRFDEIEHLEGSSNVQCFTSRSSTTASPPCGSSSAVPARSPHAHSSWPTRHGPPGPKSTRHPNAPRGQMHRQWASRHLTQNANAPASQPTPHRRPTTYPAPSSTRVQT
jgi:hypothetical protein